MGIDVAERVAALAGGAITAAALTACSGSTHVNADCRASGAHPAVSLTMTAGVESGSVAQHAQAQVGQEVDVTMMLARLSKPVLSGPPGVLCIQSTKTTPAGARFIVLVARSAGEADVNAAQPASAAATFGMTLVVDVSS